MKSVDQLSVKIFADGADLEGIIDLYRKPFIKGFTTNPTLIRKAGASDYGPAHRGSNGATLRSPYETSRWRAHASTTARRRAGDSGLAGANRRRA